MSRRCVVTVTIRVSPTSMPFNEFVQYRKDHCDERNVIICLYTKEVDELVLVPDDVEMHCLGMNVIAINQLMRIVEKQCKETGEKLVVHIHEGKTAWLFHLATGWRYASCSVYTLHSTYTKYPLHNKIQARIASYLCKKTVCCSRTSFRHYPSDLKRILGKRAISIQNGVDTLRADNCAANDRTDPEFTILYVARLVACKRQKMLLEIMQKVKDAKLILVGTGPLREALQQDVEEMGLKERVLFMGLISREEVFSLMKTVDLYVSTSSYEGLPISVLEALACGMPCIVSNIEQHQEIMEQCSSLITVEDDTDKWADEITKMMQISAERRKEIGTDNAQKVKKALSLQRMHDQYSKVYDEIERTV